MKLCNKCLLPENFPNAQLDAAGLCIYCRKGVKLSDYSHEESRFKTLIQEIKSNNQSEHDCIICYSGGKDSTYTLIQIKEKYGLLPLVFTLDNGFISQKAKENITHICKVLNLDLISVKPEPEKMKAVFKAVIKQEIFSENIISRLSAVCYVCITFVNYQAIYLALERGLRIIVSGFTHGQVPKAVFAYNPDFLKKTFVDMKRLLSENIGFEADEFYPKIDFSKLNKGNSIYNVNPLLFARYDQEKIVSTIKSYGWQRPKDVDSCSSNCLMNKVGNYYHFKFYGYHPYQHEISSLIRIGAITQEVAKEMLTDVGLDRAGREIVKELGLK